jgi:hypothetical protein
MTPLTATGADTTGRVADIHNHETGEATIILQEVPAPSISVMTTLAFATMGQRLNDFPGLTGSDRPNRAARCAGFHSRDYAVDPSRQAIFVVQLLDQTVHVIDVGNPENG